MKGVIFFIFVLCACFSTIFSAPNEVVTSKASENDVTETVMEDVEKATTPTNDNKNEPLPDNQMTESLDTTKNNDDSSKDETMTIKKDANQSEEMKPANVIKSQVETVNANMTDKTESMSSEEMEEDYELEEAFASGTLNASTIADFSPDGRLYGGTAAAATTEFPFAVVVDTPNVRTCTGAIIALRYVIVPASCVYGTAPSILRVTTLTMSGGTVTALANKIIHPKYESSPKDYNIALLRLASPITVSTTLMPVQLAGKWTSDDNKDIVNQQMRVLGYGPEAINGDASNQVLRYVDLGVLSTSECYRLTKTVDNVPYSSKQSCLANNQATGLCGATDLGSLVLRRIGTSTTYTLVGIVTYIHNCGSSVPNLFMRIGQHYDWIQKVMAIYENFQ